MQNKKVVILSIVILVGLFFIGGYFYKKDISNSNESVSSEQSQYLQRDYSIVIGPSDAKVTLVEFLIQLVRLVLSFIIMLRIY